MESLNQPSNLQPLSIIQCNHNTDGTPCTGQKVVFGRRVQICLKKDGYSDGSRDGLRTVTQFLRKNSLSERKTKSLDIQVAGTGAYGTVTFICHNNSDVHGDVCVLKTANALAAPRKNYDTNLTCLPQKKEKHTVLNTTDLKAAELNAFMLPEHENTCKTYCALIKYNSEKSWTVITSRSDIEQSKGDYTVPALLLERCSGTELQNQLDNRREISGQPISRDTIYDISLKTMKGLSSIHQSGLVIRDLKPANILYNRETGELKLIDFGLSKEIPKHDDNNKSRPRKCSGTPGFIAPELYTGGGISTQGDDWSLGVTLLSILFDGEKPKNLILEIFGNNHPHKTPDSVLSELFSNLNDEEKRSAINKKIEKNNGSIENYSELVDIIVGLTRNKFERMSTKDAMDKLQNLFDEGKVTYPEPLSEDEFNGVDPFHEFSPAEINEAATREAPTARKRGRIFKWLGLS